MFLPSGKKSMANFGGKKINEIKSHGILWNIFGWI